ncbi:MAG: TIGR01777 family oxidoreductase [Bacteroidota bacterium]
MSKHVLITGGTGLIGTRLTELLLQKGYTVALLSRQANAQPDSRGIRTYHWDIAKGEIDTQSILEADYLIHLAGAGVADKRWTQHRKQEIIDSRTQSTQLLAEHLRAIPYKLKSFISASAIGIYGADTGTDILTEATPPGTDFLADVTQRWEAAADQVAHLPIRTVKLRIGIVLSEKGGALAKIAQPIRLGAGAPLGSGKQFLSWIHVDDLARLFIYALENEQLRGVYNAVAPNPVTNEQLTQLAAKVLKKPLWLPHVPAFALRLAFGELAEVILGGNHVLNKRIAEETAFTYKFTNAENALEDLLS